jgi:hypothetical protein
MGLQKRGQKSGDDEARQRTKWFIIVGGIVFVIFVIQTIQRQIEKQNIPHATSADVDAAIPKLGRQKVAATTKLTEEKKAKVDSEEPKAKKNLVAEQLNLTHKTESEREKLLTSRERSVASVSSDFPKLLRGLPPASPPENDVFSRPGSSKLFAYLIVNDKIQMKIDLFWDTDYKIISKLVREIQSCRKTKKDSDVCQSKRLSFRIGEITDMVSVSSPKLQLDGDNYKGILYLKPELSKPTYSLSSLFFLFTPVEYMPMKIKPIGCILQTLPSGLAMSDPITDSSHIDFQDARFTFALFDEPKEQRENFQKVLKILGSSSQDVPKEIENSGAGEPEVPPS